MLKSVFLHRKLVLLIKPITDATISITIRHIKQAKCCAFFSKIKQKIIWAICCLGLLPKMDVFDFESCIRKSRG